MVEAKRRAGRKAEAPLVAATEPTSAADKAVADESERQLGRYFAMGLPATAAVVAVAVGALVGLGPGILVLAGGGLLGTIALFWASVRTLSGEAPLAEGFSTMTVRTAQRTDSAVEEKRTVLRALKDLEFEHSVGKIDDDDYAELDQRYRTQAKALLRELDVDIEPLRAQAEEAARLHLAKRGLTSTEAFAETKPSAEAKPTAARSAPRAEKDLGGPLEERRPCLACKALNEADAAFCKGCGSRLRKDSCPGCETLNELDADFCKKCGRKLEATERAEHDAPA
jgi:hypothetical protein